MMNRMIAVMWLAACSAPALADQIVVDAEGFGDYTNIQDATSHRTATWFWSCPGPTPHGTRPTPKW